MKRRLPPLLFFAGLLVLWHILVEARVWPEYILPSPLKVGAYIAQAVADGSLPGATFITLRRLLCGYAVGLCIGIPAGFLTSRSRFAEETLGVIALGLQALPSVCWVPFAILAFGQTEAAMLFVVVMGCVWSVQIAADNGVRTVPPIYVQAAKTMGSKGLHTWLKVIVPAALPFIVSGMKQGWAFAWRSLMAAEIYVTIITGFGLGQLLHAGREFIRMDQVIGIMLVIIAIGLLTDRILFSPWERFLHRRWGTLKRP